MQSLVLCSANLFCAKHDARTSRAVRAPPPRAHDLGAQRRLAQLALALVQVNVHLVPLLAAPSATRAVTTQNVQGWASAEAENGASEGASGCPSVRVRAGAVMDCCDAWAAASGCPQAGLAAANDCPRGVSAAANDGAAAGTCCRAVWTPAGATYCHAAWAGATCCRDLLAAETDSRAASAAANDCPRGGVVAESDCRAV